ncbi:MAG: succinate dehydrogenase, partial [Bacteroidota bacterium]
MSAVALSNPFRTSIGQKFIVALTGIFLITFLIVHVAGNLLLFVGPEEFNAYAHFMGTNPIIRTMEIVLFAGFIGHIVTALAVTFKSRKARKVSYKKTDYS